MGRSVFDGLTYFYAFKSIKNPDSLRFKYLMILYIATLRNPQNS